MGDDCKSVEKQLCVKNNTNNGAKCVAASPCSQDSDCITNINFRYSKCIGGTCANCKTTTDCTGGLPNKDYCGITPSGYTLCTYQKCSSTSECPSGRGCFPASKFNIYDESILSQSEKICTFECSENSDCR